MKSPDLIKVLHGQAGEGGPAQWNAACWPRQYWNKLETAVPLTDDPERITCHECRFVLDLPEE